MIVVILESFYFFRVCKLIFVRIFFFCGVFVKYVACFDRCFVGSFVFRRSDAFFVFELWRVLFRF